MSNAFHRRVFILSYFDDKIPKFATLEDQNAFHQALGRMVAYGLQSGAEHDTIQLVSSGITQKPLEIDAAYYRPIQASTVDEDGFYRGLPVQYEESEFRFNLASQSEGTPFVMGAVLHEDGKWGFHS